MNDTHKSFYENQASIPYPLDKGSLLNRLGTLAPPSVMLSWASLLAFLVTIGVLRFNKVLQTWFRIELDSNNANSRTLTLGIIVFTVLFSWLIALICRSRPGPILPRLWVLALALGASAVAFMQVLFRQWENLDPLMDALTVACFAATLALIPRLVRLHPNSAWTQRAAPVSLLIVLALLMPPLLWIANKAEHFQRQGFQNALKDMEAKVQSLHGCTGYDKACPEQLYQDSKKRLNDMVNYQQWQESAHIMGQIDEFDNAKLALLNNVAKETLLRLQRQVAKGTDNWQQQGLTGINLNELKDLLYLAARLDNIGSDSEAYKAYTGLLDVLATTLAMSKVRLTEAPVLYTANEHGPWPPKAIFNEISQKTIAYTKP